MWGEVLLMISTDKRLKFRRHISILMLLLMCSGAFAQPEKEEILASVVAQSFQGAPYRIFSMKVVKRTDGTFECQSLVRAADDVNGERVTFSIDETKAIAIVKEIEALRTLPGLPTDRDFFGSRDVIRIHQPFLDDITITTDMAAKYSGVENFKSAFSKTYVGLVFMDQGLIIKEGTPLEWHLKNDDPGD